MSRYRLKINLVVDSDDADLKRLSAEARIHIVSGMIKQLLHNGTVESILEGKSLKMIDVDVDTCVDLDMQRRMRDERSQK